MKQYGTPYYSYILVYVDDVLCISSNPLKYMYMLSAQYNLKQESVKAPTLYLGENIMKRTTSQGGKEYWEMGGNTYVKEALCIVNTHLEYDNLQFYTKSHQPFSKQDYRSELDVSHMCNEDQATFYQNIVGILRCMIELGRVDILYEVSQLSKHLEDPIVGHLYLLIHIFSYLNAHDRSWLVFDDRIIKIIEP